MGVVVSLDLGIGTLATSGYVRISNPVYQDAIVYDAVEPGSDGKIPSHVANNRHNNFLGIQPKQQ